MIDNASRDASAEIARQHRSAPQVIASGANLGFGRAINQATRGRTFDYLLLLNPDAVLQEGALEALLAAARQDPLAGLYGGRSIRPDGTGFGRAVPACADADPRAQVCRLLRVSDRNRGPRPRWAAPGQKSGTLEVPHSEGS